MTNYRENQAKMDNFKNEAKANKTDKERIIEEILRKQRFRFKFKKGFLRDTEEFTVVDFYLPRPYRTGIQISELKAIKLDKGMFAKRLFHLLTLKEEDFLDLTKLEDKIKVFLSNSKDRNKGPRKGRQIIVR